ncbi:peptidase A24A prepilin type IV [Sphingobium chlorophenolicum L-1]|uniref:Peptidase A24A prepilin type IV n=1 Tax=Sphingobium chlorophenolicum L-1 TaxID=690566 RepID=F6EW20_SPHCR|nr:prepilin peptidase [Sphingobium chlorophenolicum]AEG48066.1 peptidase A24A prepilin type IV [Sphingobium chlorophenolicum L-1]
MMKDVVLLAVSLVLIAAAVEDMARLRISNIFPLLVIGLYAAWVAAAGWENDIWRNGTVFLGMFALGCGLFALRWMGGGDIKLMSTCALWFDWQGVVPWLVYVTVGGGVLALVLMIGRRLVPQAVREGSSIALFDKKGPIPYGVAIALGTIMALYMAGPNPSGIAHMPDFVQGLHLK